jgi:Amt family ammonium transporter
MRVGILAGSAVLIAVTVVGAPSPASAEEAAPVTETAYIFNSLSFLMHGFLVMWMAAGFTMLEAGLVRTKNVATICLKNIALFSIAGILYYLVGYNLMYTGVDGGVFGTFA